MVTCARVFVLSPCVSLCSSVRDSLPRFAGEKAKSTAVYSISPWVSYLPTNTDTVSLSSIKVCVCVCVSAQSYRKGVVGGAIPALWHYRPYRIVGVVHIARGERDSSSGGLSHVPSSPSPSPSLHLLQPLPVGHHQSILAS